MNQKQYRRTREKLNDDVPNSVIIKYLLKENQSLRRKLGEERAYIQELEDEIDRSEVYSSQKSKVPFLQKWTQKYEDKIKYLQLENGQLEKNNAFLLQQVNDLLAAKGCDILTLNNHVNKGTD